MRAFGVAHVSWLAAIAILAILLPWLCRGGRLPERVLRYTLGGLLAVNELVRNFHDGFQFPNNLPIHLCTVLTWSTVIACFTLAPRAVEISYFVGLAGAGMAVLTPDLHSPTASYATIRYFISHGGIVIAATTLVFGKLAPLARGAVWRANAMVVVYAVFLGIFDAVFHINYMYLCRKPKGPSLLDLLGPWPVYLVLAEVVCLALFGLLWLPVRPVSSAAQDFERRTAQLAPEG